MLSGRQVGTAVTLGAVVALVLVVLALGTAGNERYGPLNSDDAAASRTTTPARAQPVAVPPIADEPTTTTRARAVVRTPARPAPSRNATVAPAAGPIETAADVAPTTADPTVTTSRSRRDTSDG